VLESASPYTALATDQLILVDNALGSTVVTVNMPAAPVAGQRHTVKWWKSNATPAGPPIISGNGNNIESWTAATGSSGTAATTTINQIGGEGTWEWAPTVSGTAVNRWVLVA
jgi:hypothetical protein